jgi:hypothetical protein
MQVTQASQNHSEGITGGVERQFQFTEEIARASEGLNRMASELQETLSKFRVRVNNAGTVKIRYNVIIPDIVIDNRSPKAIIKYK